MKKFILLFALVSFLFSCSDDESIPEPLRGRVTCKIDGIEKVFTKGNSFISGVLGLGDSPDELISMFFPIPTTFPTTYNMDSESIITAAYFLNGKTYNSTNGVMGIGAKGSLSITITKYSNSKISGTFEFTGITDENEQIVITEGAFENIPDL